MTLLGFDVEELAKIVALVETHGLAEIIIEEEGRYLRVRGPQAKLQPVGKEQMAALAEPAVLVAVSPTPNKLINKKRETPSSHPPSFEDMPGRLTLTSPMMGVFYRAEKPSGPPLVNVGDRVEVGQTVGVLEAMKVFSEFKSEFAGVVVAILVEDGQLVEAGMPLIVLQKDM